MPESPIKLQKISSQISQRTKRKIKKKCSKDFVYEGYFSPGYDFKLQSLNYNFKLQPLFAKLKAI